MTVDPGHQTDQRTNMHSASAGHSLVTFCCPGQKVTRRPAGTGELDLDLDLDFELNLNLNLKTPSPLILPFPNSSQRPIRRCGDRLRLITHRLMRQFQRPLSTDLLERGNRRDP